MSEGLIQREMRKGFALGAHGLRGPRPGANVGRASRGVQAPLPLPKITARSNAAELTAPDTQRSRTVLANGEKRGGGAAAYGHRASLQEAPSAMHSSILSGSRRAALYDGVERRQAKLDSLQSKFESLGQRSKSTLRDSTRARGEQLVIHDARDHYDDEFELTQTGREDTHTNPPLNGEDLAPKAKPAPQSVDELPTLSPEAPDEETPDLVAGDDQVEGLQPVEVIDYTD